MDTAVDCGVALLVFLLLVPAGLTTWLSTAIADTLDVVATASAKAARRDLQRSALRLTQTYDNAINGSARQRRVAEHVWPAIAATQRLAYRTVAECWRLEQRLLEEISTTDHFADARPALAHLADAVRAGRTPPLATVSTGALTAELTAELCDVRDTLRS